MAKKPGYRAKRGATKKAAPNQVLTEDAGKKAPNQVITNSAKPEGGNDKSNDDLIKLAREIYQAGFDKDRENQEQAYIDLKFIAGDEDVHWDPKARAERIDEGRPALVVNQGPQFVRQVTGDMRQMRPAIKVVPIDDQASDDVAAKILPGMIRYIEGRSDASGIYFAAADQQVGAGIGHWMVTHEYSSARTFNQELRIAPVPDGIAVVWDADAVLPTREDATDCFVPWDMSARSFKAKYPDSSFAPLTEVSEAFTSWIGDNHVRVAIWFHKVPEMKRLGVYPDGRIDDVTDDKEAEAKATQLGAKIEEREGFCTYRYLISANEILEDGEKVPGGVIPVVPVLGEEVVIGKRTVRRGVIRVLRDVQRIYNYAISTQTEVIALQPKAPFIGTRRQFEKYVDQWETANTRNWPYLEYENEPGVPAPQRAQPPVASQGLEELMTATRDGMHAVTGIYPAALGAKSNETSGRAIMARQREGDTGTYVYLDNFSRAIRRCGQICVDMIPDVYDTSRTIQITGEDGKIDKMQVNKLQLGEDGETHVSLNDVTKGAYLVAVEMGPSYSTKREEAREGMMELIRTLGPQGAMLFLDLLIKAMDWPLADQIAKRAEANLPHEVRVREAEEAGREPPKPPEPPPLTPEQQQVMEEAQQANIEKARENEIAERNQVLEQEKIELEREKVKLEKGKVVLGAGQLDNDASAQDLERRGQDLEARGQDNEARQQDVDAVGMGAQEIENQRKIAGTNEPAKAGKSPAKAGDVDQQQQADIDELKGTIAELLEQVMMLTERVEQLAGGTPDLNANDGITPDGGLELQGAPPAQLPGPPPELIDPGAAAAMGEELPPIL